MLTLMTALCVAAPVVFVDGERVETTQVSPNAVVATAGRVTLWLTADRVWRLTTEWSKQDDAVLVFDERRALVGVSLRVKAKGRTPRFAGRDLSSLRGFSVEGWDSDVERLIKALPEASCASIESAPLTLEVRKLPAGLECLELDFEGSEKLLTLDLSRFTKLTWLSVSAGEHARLKALPKALTNVTLRRLKLDVVSLTRLEGLVSLTLDDVNVRELSGRLGALQTLWFTGREDTEFKAFEAPRLAKLTIRGAARGALDITAPTLAEAVLLDTGFSADSLVAFSERHPRTVVVTDWSAFFRHHLRNTDRVRVRSGGGCHRQRGEEKTIHEFTSAKEMQELLAATVIGTERRSSFCMCCGGPSMEFFSDGVLIDSISFQHGAKIRWSEWFGDLPLANDSLVRFLSSHGVKEPLEDVMKQQLEIEAIEAWRTAFLALLPARLQPLFEQGTATDLVEELRKEVPERIAFIRLALKLLGARTASWTGVIGPQERFEEALGSVTAEELLAVTEKRPLSPELEEGLSRLLLSPKPPQAAFEPAVRGLVVELAKKALGRPWVSDRFKAVSSLAAAKDERATSVLRQLVAGTLPFSTEEKTTPDGSQWRYQSSSFEFAVTKLVPDTRLAQRDLRVLAAWALVLRGTPDIRPQLLALRPQLAENDAALLNAALARLDLGDAGTK